MKFVCDSCQAQYSISDDKVGPNGVAVRCKKCQHKIIVKRLAPPDSAESTVVMQIPASMMDAAASGGVGAAVGGPATIQSMVATSAAHPAEALTNTGSLPFDSGGKGGEIEDDIGKAFDSVLGGGLGGDERTSTGEGPQLNGAPNGSISSFGVPPAGGGPFGEDVSRDSTRVVNLADFASALKEPAREPEKKNGVNGHSEKPAESAAPANDWFVAINDAQVGPLGVEGVREHWNKGSLSADSLVWRTGMGDWKPLSSVAELAQIIAPVPKPQMPQSAAAAATAALEEKEARDGRKEPHAGAVATGTQSPSASVAPPPSEMGEPEWKPSAASALQSLVDDELEALKKPAAKPAEPAGVSAGESAAGRAKSGLLDLPSEEHEAPVTGQAALPEKADREPPHEARPSSRPSPVSEPEEREELPTVKNPLPRPRRRDAEEQAPRPTGDQPRSHHAVSPPEAMPQRSGNGTAIAIGIGGGIIGLGALVAMLVVLLKPQAAVVAPVNPPVVQVQPTPTPVAVMPTPTPVAANPVTPVAVTPTVTPPIEAKVPEKAPVGEEKPPVGEKPPAVRPPRTAMVTPPPRIAAPLPHAVTPPPRAVREPPPERETPPPPSTSGKSKVDEDFDKIFGGGGGGNTEAPPPKAEKKPKTVYVPPAVASTKPKLEQSDIMGVVVSNKPAIKNCVAEQKAKDANASGTVVMRWIIKPDGATANVQTITEEFRKTPMSSCMAAAIKSWHFDGYSGPQMAPIDFPFKF